MIEYDKGPTKKMARLFARFPDYEPYKEHFWFDWGPIFYRGRLDGSVRLLCVASDPGPTERIAYRALVGDAGQRVQGFLAKLGLTRSYVCLNAFVFALHPSHFYSGKTILKDPEHIKWRNRVFDKVTSSNLQAIVAFGSLAQIAVNLWDAGSNLPIFNLYHPSYRNLEKLLPVWRDAISQLRQIITPDPDGDPTIPNYGEVFTEADYAKIPRRDLPFGAPEWLGDDAWGRSATPPHRNCVRRPIPDDGHTLIWLAPKT
jgi:uracil-DNA glycosylase